MYILGIDTGGTYTDGIVMDYDTKEVVHTAKVFTTKEDLSICIRDCFDALKVDHYEGIRCICLSTTLATNAIVEGTSCCSGAILIGKEPKGELPDSTYELVDGLLDIKGNVKIPLNEAEVLEKLDVMQSRDRAMESIAISCYASARNPAFEIRVKKLVRDKLDIPVVCAHELSSKLGFKERTVSSVLNAGLVPIITELIEAVVDVIREHDLNSTLMLVDSTGCLTHSRRAVDQPIRTILSGPASSMLGGQYLTGIRDGMIVDIGGTTTDIAVVQDSKVDINEDGATVGRWKTNTVAAKIHTFGLGGDSRIFLDEDGELHLTERRQWPIAYMISRYPYLKEELREYRDSGRFIDCEVISKYRKTDLLETSPKEREVLELIEEGPHCKGYLAEKLGKENLDPVIDRLFFKNRVIGGGFTPTDLLHVTGVYTPFDREGSEMLLKDFAKRRNETPEVTIDLLSTMIANKLKDCCDTVMPESEGREIVMIGAPAQAWAELAEDTLGNHITVPAFSSAANAIGAAIGNISPTVDILIRPDPESGKFFVYYQAERTRKDSADEAKAFALEWGRERIRQVALDNECSNFETFEYVYDVHSSDSHGQRYIETRIKLIAIGKPDIYFSS